MPVQPSGAHGIEGSIEIERESKDRPFDLLGFERIILIISLITRGIFLTGCSLLDTTIHGVFVTRAPKRSSPIGISVVRLTEMEGCRFSL